METVVSGYAASFPDDPSWYVKDRSSASAFAEGDIEIMNTGSTSASVDITIDWELWGSVFTSGIGSANAKSSFAVFLDGLVLDQARAGIASYGAGPLSYDTSGQDVYTVSIAAYSTRYLDLDPDSNEAAVPVPAPLFLIAAGALGLTFRRRAARPQA